MTKMLCRSILPLPSTRRFLLRLPDSFISHMPLMLFFFFILTIFDSFITSIYYRQSVVFCLFYTIPFIFINCYQYCDVLEPASYGENKITCTELKEKTLPLLWSENICTHRINMNIPS